MSVAQKKNNSAVKVYMRQRPLNTTEIEHKCLNVVHAIHPREVALKNGFNERRFVCDHVFGESTTQLELYNATLAPMINNVIGGYNCTLFTYGQTGSGKTYTVFGDLKQARGFDLKDNSVGLILRASQHLFSDLSKLSVRTEYTVRISCVEICSEEVRDLFSDNTPLRVYDDPLVKGSVCMKELSKITVFNSQDVLNWINIGLLARQKAAAPNVHHSRSHVIFTFLVNVRDVTNRGDEIIKTGRLQLLDLGGHENVGRERARDAGNAHRSINTLTRVIKAVAQKMQHIPYRDSKLTRILQDSLSGNTKTAMIATFSPSSAAWDETVATLELGQLARSIVTNSHVNVNRKQANLLKELDDEVSRLKDELAAAKRGQGVFVSSQTFEKMTDDANDGKQKVLELVSKIAELGNHRTSLENQCRSLEQSFHETKDYLETAKQMLAEKQSALQEEEIKVSIAKKEQRYMVDVTNTLLDVCNNSTRNEEIYYKKYQERCAANQHNAQMSKEMLATTSSFLQDTVDSAEKNLSENFSKLNQIIHSIDALSNQTQSSARHMDAVTAGIRRYADRNNITLKELLTKDSECFLPILQGFVTGVYELKLADVNAQTEISNFMEALKKKYEADLRELATQCNQTSQSVHEIIHQQQVFKETVKKDLSDVASELQKRKAALLEQRAQNEAAAVFYRREIARADQEEQALLKRDAELKAAMAKMKALKDQNANINMEQVDQTISSYLQKPREIVHNSVSGMNDALEEVDSNQTRTCTQASLHRSAINVQFTQLAATANDNLSQLNEELREILQEWQASLSADCRETLTEKTMPITDQTLATLSQLSQVQIQRIGDLKIRFDDAVKDLDQSIVNINSVGHAGDTPTKRTYSYPRIFGASKHNVNGSPNGSPNLSNK